MAVYQLAGSSSAFAEAGGLIVAKNLLSTTKVSVHLILETAQSFRAEKKNRIYTNNTAKVEWISNPAWIFSLV